MHIYKHIATAAIAASAIILGAGAAGAFQSPASNASSNQTAERLAPTMPTDDRIEVTR